MKDENKNRARADRTFVRESAEQLDQQTVRAQSNGDATGPEYWRSLEELAGSDEFREMMHREFPKGASEWVDRFSRRGFLKTMGASLALAGLTGCTKLPLSRIVPYVKQPENLVPGEPMYYATAFTLAVTRRRSWSKATCSGPPKLKAIPIIRRAWAAPTFYAQASLLDLYDPDRSQNITYMGDVRFLDALSGSGDAGQWQRKKGFAGGGVRILTQTVSSPPWRDRFATT